MANTGYDPAEYKAQQREQWSNAADGWRRRWPVFERAAQALSDRMMDLARITPGKRVLDVATGIGEPAMTAARRVGPSGSVVALDQAPRMLAIARERMRAGGLTNVECIEGDAETVALPPDSFDAVVCRWALFFFPNPVGTLARLRATLTAGGRLAAAVWGPPARVPQISLSFGVLARELGRPPAPPAGPSPFAFADPAPLEQVMRDAGFADVRSEPFTVTLDFPSADEYVGYLRDISATTRAMLAPLGPERQADIWGKIGVAAAAYADASGTIHMPNDCLLVVGQR
jgi:SAM-dependent methyltransferase